LHHSQQSQLTLRQQAHSVMQRCQFSHVLEQQQMERHMHSRFLLTSMEQFFFTHTDTVQPLQFLQAFLALVATQ
jgi:hypothetical protein